MVMGRVIGNIVSTRKNENSSSPLSCSILGGIDDTPLDKVAQVIETRQNHAKIATALCGRRFEQSINILKESKRPCLHCDTVFLL